MAELSLNGKVVVVTGAGGGLGREFALAAGAAGAYVVVNDIGTALDGTGADTDPAKQVVAEIESAGGVAVANTDSVATWETARRIVATAIDAFERVDVVINNAGILRDRLFFAMTEEDWRSVIDVHLHGSFFVSRAAAERMKQQEAGAFVHITSTSGLVGNLGQANYSAAKLGIVALSRSIALDMARFGVRSNCIAPFAWSRMTASIPAKGAEGEARVARLQRMQGGQVAPLAVYLASDAASAVTGQVFTVRGNEIFLMSQSRPLRSVHRSEGWTPGTIGEHALPALGAQLYPLERSPDVFSWDPV
jgi:NAD(P)-dependent dehydrogenase (short-subunit alcohol dehydrogenase family)